LRAIFADCPLLRRRLTKNSHTVIIVGPILSRHQLLHPLKSLPQFHDRCALLRERTDLVPNCLSFVTVRTIEVHSTEGGTLDEQAHQLRDCVSNPQSRNLTTQADFYLQGGLGGRGIPSLLVGFGQGNHIVRQLP